MKTHINQILTVVSFFSLSITTILFISWGMNGFSVQESLQASHCKEQYKNAMTIKQSKQCHDLKMKYGSLKILVPKIKVKLNRS